MKTNVTCPSLPPFDEYIKEIETIWESKWLTNSGPLHQRFEEELLKYLETENLVLFTNGHLALENAIALFNFPKGSEVITTPFTFVSTTNAIVRNGLIPVFCDINPNDFTIDASKIEKLINDKTVAIVGVHVYGKVCDVETIAKIAEKHHLKVIYDAAHAFGVKFKNQNVSNFGDVTMFSFHATKVFNSIEGGCLTFKDSSFKKQLESVKNFGLCGQEECDAIGLNAKMNEFQAAMGLCNLRHVDEYIAKRKTLYSRYLTRLENVNGIVLPKDQEDLNYNYAYFPIVFDGFKKNRDQIKDNLKEKGIEARKYFFPLTSDFACYKSFEHGDTPVADYVSKHILTLPLYPDLSLKEVDYICDLILE